MSRLFTQSFVQVQIKENKFRVTGLCEGNSPLTGEFPAGSQWVNSVPPYVRKFHFMYEVVRISSKCHRSIYFVNQANATGAFIVNLANVAGAFIVHQGNVVEHFGS